MSRSSHQNLLENQVKRDQMKGAVSLGSHSQDVMIQHTSKVGGASKYRCNFTTYRCTDFGDCRLTFWIWLLKYILKRNGNATGNYRNNGIVPFVSHGAFCSIVPYTWRGSSESWERLNMPSVWFMMFVFRIQNANWGCKKPTDIFFQRG